MRNDDYYSQEDLKEEYGIDELTFYRMIREKKVPAFRMQGKWKIRKADIYKLVEIYNQGDICTKRN